MSESLYLLVCDDCKTADASSIEYLYFGTEDEVREEMMNRYFNETYPWASHYYTSYGAHLWDNPDEFGFDRHINWWMMGIGAPDNGPLYLVTRGHAQDGGGVSTEIVAATQFIDMAKSSLCREFGKELANPSFYAGWDPEYCEIDEWHALASVETMDSLVSFDLFQVIDHQGRIIHDINRGFEYLG